MTHSLLPNLVIIWLHIILVNFKDEWVKPSLKIMDPWFREKKMLTLKVGLTFGKLSKAQLCNCFSLINHSHLCIHFRKLNHLTLLLFLKIIKRERERKVFKK